MTKALLILFLYFAYMSSAAAGRVNIGVLAYNGKPQALERWQATADYLSEKIPEHQFNIKPLTLKGFENALNKKTLDFILTNSGHYVALEKKFSASRIVTFLSRYKAQTLKHFSAVIFTRKDSGIHQLNDLRGRTFAAVNQAAFGGFQLAQDAFLQQGIDLLKDVDIKWLGFPHVEIVESVLSGKISAGTVRAGVLEKMDANGLIDLSEVLILEAKKTQIFPFLHSVALYPEWPLAKLSYTDTELAKQVAIYLLDMPSDSAVAIKSLGAGWTIPLDYTIVHNVLQRLHTEPYLIQPINLIQFLKNYQYWLIIIIFVFVLALFKALRLFKSNQSLKTTQQIMINQQSNLEQQYEQDLDQAQLSLKNETSEHIKIQQALIEGCVEMGELHQIFLRKDLTSKQRLHSIVECIRQHLDMEVGLLSYFNQGHFEVCSYSPSSIMLTSPLSESLSKQAISKRTILLKQNTSQWQSYIANPVFIDGSLHCLFEFASTKPNDKLNQKDNAFTKFSFELLNLVSQWVGSEVLAIEHKKQQDEHLLAVKARFTNISKREKDVLSILVQGKSTKAIARLLNLSPKTVEMHRASLIKKTQTESSIELAQLAVLAKIVKHSQ